MFPKTAVTPWSSAGRLAIRVLIIFSSIIIALEAAELSVTGYAPRPIATAPLYPFGATRNLSRLIQGNIRTVFGQNCSTGSTDDIVLALPRKGVSMRNNIMEAYQKGATAILAFANSNSLIPGLAQFLLNQEETSSIPVPVFELTRKDALVLWKQLRHHERLFNASNGDDCYFATISISNNEPNVWDIDFKLPIVFVVFDVTLPALALIALILSARKLVLFIMATGFQISVPIVFLGLDCISNITRAIFFAVDPFGKRGVWPAGAVSILISVTWPITLINTLLIALFYRELHAGPIKMGFFLDELKIPFLIISIFVFAMELLTTSFSAGWYVSEPLMIVVRLTYALITIVVAAMLFTAGMAVLKKANISDIKTRGTKLMMAASAIMVLYAIVLLAVIYGEHSSPASFISIYSLLFCFIFIIGIIQVAAFDPNRAYSRTPSRATTSHGTLSATGTKRTTDKSRD